MDNFCGYCGCRLDGAIGFCPRCKTPIAKAPDPDVDHPPQTPRQKETPSLNGGADVNGVPLSAGGATGGAKKRNVLPVVLACVAVLGCLGAILVFWKLAGKKPDTVTPKYADAASDAADALPAAEAAQEATDLPADASPQEAWEAGDIVSFGTYPQSLVSSADLIQQLDKVNKNWQSYGYYSGNYDRVTQTGGLDDGKMQPGDWMRYADITLDGEKYRAVTFDKYRPDATTLTSSSTNQDDNGYQTGNVYYFLYEPILWRVLDPDAGLLLSENQIDAQAFHNTIYNDGAGEYWQDTTAAVYANNYAESSLRQWLNDDFYNTAFSAAEKTQIGKTDLDNSSPDALYSCSPTSDKVFLLSRDDVTNRDYGFSTSVFTEDDARRAQGTDYADCQGRYISGLEDVSSYWWLRTPGGDLGNAYYVLENGSVEARYSVDSTDGGIRPAIRIRPDGRKVKSGK